MEEEEEKGPASFPFCISAKTISTGGTGERGIEVSILTLHSQTLLMNDVIIIIMQER